MPNWLASELCMLVSFSLGAWKTFKVLKDGGTDYNLLRTWCLLSLVRVFEEYFELLVSWIPFYWLGKCCGLALLLVPETNISTVLFERVVVWGMDNAHHFLGNLVVPNVVEFAVSLPWRLLHVVFPNTHTTFPPLIAPSNGGIGYSSSSGSSKGLGLAARLQHLQVPNRAAVDNDFSRDARYGQSPESESTPKQSHEEGRLGSASLSPPPLLSREAESNAVREGQASSKGPAEGVASVGDESPPREKSPWALGKGGIFGHRSSFGEMVRATLTGDSKTRLRDHLFDLHSPSPASPTPGESETTARRSGAAESHSIIDDGKAKRKAKKPATKRALGSEKRSGEASAPGERTRNPTRQRPSELSRNVSERGGVGGGDEAAGRVEGGGRRRNRLAQRGTSADEINTSAGDTLNSSTSTSPRGANFGLSTRETSDTRAKRLEEWRKRRSKHLETQSAGLRRRGGKGAGADATPGPATTFATQPGSSEGGGRVNLTPSRRFRHVERFRSEVGKTAGDT